LLKFILHKTYRTILINSFLYGVIMTVPDTFLFVHLERDYGASRTYSGIYIHVFMYIWLYMHEYVYTNLYECIWFSAFLYGIIMTFPDTFLFMNLERDFGTSRTNWGIYIRMFMICAFVFTEVLPSLYYYYYYYHKVIITIIVIIFIIF
jgi:hypothetical protein